MADHGEEQTAVTDQQVHRLLAAIFPSRPEKVLGRIVTWAYSRNERGVHGFIGDRADDLRVLSVRVRAWWKRRNRAATGRDVDRG